MPGESSATPAPDARLLIAPGCAHCPAVLDGLSRLVKEGLIGRLEVVNIATRPDVAEAEAVRTVPWVRIGPYTLTGSHTPGELAEWAERAAQGSGLASYFAHLLETNRFEEAVALIRQSPGSLEDLIIMLGDLETPMSVRIGIGAVVEELADADILGATVDALGALARSEHAQVRADACHYLGLTANPRAIPLLQSCVEDESHEVREIASESLALLHKDTVDG